MRPFLTFTTTLMVLVCACSTTSVNQTPNLLTRLPPPVELSPHHDLLSVEMHLDRQLQERPSEQLRWWTRYEQARLWRTADPARSCRAYLELAGDEEFPLAHVAQLRALEACPAEEPRLPTIDALLQSTKEPWLQELVTRAAFARAIALKDEAWEMKLAVETSKHEPLQSDKIRLMSRALELAEKLGQTEAKEEHQKRLWQIAPRLLPDPDRRQFLEVAADFRQDRQFDKAREYFRKVVEDPIASDSDKYRALDGIRLAYKLEKKTDAYVQATKDMTAFARKRFNAKPTKKAWTAKYFDARILLSRTLWTETTVKEALAELAGLEKETLDAHPPDEIHWLRARIAEESGKFPEALAHLAKAGKSGRIDRSLHQKILWYQAWNLYKAKRFSEAVLALRGLDKIDDNPYTIVRNRFWLGKALSHLNDQDGAKSTFEWLIENDPVGYYGLLAYRELKRKLPPPVPGGAVPLPMAQQTSKEPRAPASLPGLLVADANAETEAADGAPMTKADAPAVTDETPAEATGAVATTNPDAAGELPSPFEPERDPAAAAALAFASPADHAYAEWLLAVSEKDIARRFLDHVSQAYRETNMRDQEKWTELLKFYARAGSYQSLFGQLGMFPAEVRNEILRREPTLLFPQPYAEFASEASKKFGVQVELIYSIMRQESSFNPNARSHADAFGLMQLIPEMAARAEEPTGIKLKSPEDLYKPEINIPMGAAFLREMLTRFDEQFVMTVASYNASEKAIRGWIKTRYRGDPLEFIEDIPYDETRGYVKLVLRNFIFYLRLNAGPQETDFPEWCLEGLQPPNV